jgi:hypothetical protein
MSGNYYKWFNNTQDDITFDSNQSEIYGALKFCPISDNCGIFEFKDSGGTEIMSLRTTGSSPTAEISARRGNYNATELDSGGVIANDTVYLLEVYFKPLDSGGVVTVKLDGIQLFSFSGDSTAGLENIKSMHWGTHNGVLGGYFKCDDIVFDSSGWIGDTRFQKVQISGAGTTSEWDGGYANIDEIPYSDADEVSTNVVDESITCACANLTGDISSIKNFILEGRMAYEGSPTPTKQKLAIRVNGTEYYGDDISPGISFAAYYKNWEDNPDDAAAWEEADINAIEIGGRSVT